MMISLQDSMSGINLNVKKRDCRAGHNRQM